MPLDNLNYLFEQESNSMVKLKTLSESIKHSWFTITFDWKSLLKESQLGECALWWFLPCWEVTASDKLSLFSFTHREEFQRHSVSNVTHCF